MSAATEGSSAPGAAVTGVVMLAGAALAGLAVYNRVHAAAAEAANPPRGSIINVGGVGVHVVEHGPPDGPPVVLLHGNVVTLE